MVLNKDQVKEKIRKASGLEIELVFIPLIMRNQTDEEKQLCSTNEHNGKGLNSYDGKIIGFYYQQIKAGQHLTKAQIEKAREKLLKYSGQFAEMTVAVSA